MRRRGIDFREKRQAYYQNAKQASALVFGKEVTIQTHGQDKYGLTLGNVFFPGWDERQPGNHQERLVLVVSKVRSTECGA